MRASDIVNQLARYLPAMVDDFTTQIAISALSSTGTTATATTAAPHGLLVGQQVNITGAIVPVAITSIDRVGTIATMVTTTDHDLTENAGFDVVITGATEPEFNGTFKLLRVLNRRTITFQVADSGATAATGAPLLMNGSNPFQTYNGIRQITAVTASSFDFEVPAGLYSPASGTIIAKTGIRISSSVEYERIEQAYTKQNPNEAWLFVVMNDAVADKNRRIDIGATDNLQQGNYFNQRLIQSVSLYCVMPTANQIAGRSARDRCEELLKPICNSVLTCRFPSLVENSNNPLMITGHGYQFYNTAIYIHQYSFEATLQMGESDIFVPDVDVAFRDIDLTNAFAHGNGLTTTEIDLDDEML